MAGSSSERRSRAAFSVASHVGGVRESDQRLERYHERVGRVRTERAVWPGAAFIVEALLLVVFLTGSLAVLMSLNAAADANGRQSADLMNAIVMASNSAEQFAADPEGAAEAQPGGAGDTAGGVGAVSAAGAAEAASVAGAADAGDADTATAAGANANVVRQGNLLLIREVQAESTTAGTIFHAVIKVWNQNDVAAVEASDGGQAAFELTMTDDAAEPVYTLETSAYVPDVSGGVA